MYFLSNPINLICLICYFLFLNFSYAIEAPETLQFVQIWFRHGARMPSAYLKLKDELDLNFTFESFAYPKELVPRGIQQSYRLGEILQSYYGKFLGKYNPLTTRFNSGVDNRTINTALYMLQALYPDRQDRFLELENGELRNIGWDVIPVHTDESLDWLSNAIDSKCPHWANMLYEVPVFANINLVAEPRIVKYLEEHSGETDDYELFKVIDALKCRYFLNDSRLPVPDWAKADIEKLLYYDCVFQNQILDFQNGTVGGYHLNMILSEFEQYLIRGPMDKNKAVFFGGHDTNLIAIFKALSINETDLKIPEFCSYMAIELHHINNSNVVQIWYAETLEAPRKNIKIPYCPAPCTLERLQELAKNTRKTLHDITLTCKGLGTSADFTSAASSASVLAMLFATLFILSVILLGYLTISYRQKYLNFKEPERMQLLQRMYILLK